MVSVARIALGGRGLGWGVKNTDAWLIKTIDKEIGTEIWNEVNMG
jgi:hypothetical protein